MVLGLRSVEGDDGFAQRLTSALREAAEEVPGWDINDRRVSLDQMSLAHGCDQPDASCLSNIATTLQARHLVYGTVRRSSVRTDFRFFVSLYVFDARAGEIRGSLTDFIAPARGCATGPMASYWSKASPNGSMLRWQAAQLAFLACASILWRMVTLVPLGGMGSIGSTLAGGGGGVLLKIASLTQTPRCTGRWRVPSEVNPSTAPNREQTAPMVLGLERDALEAARLRLR